MRRAGEPLPGDVIGPWLIRVAAAVKVRAASGRLGANPGDGGKTMNSRNRSGLLLGPGVLILVLSAGAVLAQAVAQPLPPGSPLLGRPDTEEAKRLAPIAPPPIPTAADKLPLDKLKAPKDFKIEVFMANVANARQMSVGERGTVFVGSRLVGKVHAVVTRDGKRELKLIASGLHRPNGVAVHDGALYIAELSRISRIDHIEDQLDAPPAPTLVYDDLPKDEAHGWKFIGFGPDGKLYVPVGQPCNNCLPPPTHGQIRRLNVDASGVEVVARGVRNSVGFDWHPVTKELYFTDNGRDWLSEDVPEDKLNRVTKTGEHFGVPYCYQGNIADPEFGWGHSCSEFTPPVALMGPHSASLGMRFTPAACFRPSTRTPSSWLGTARGTGPRRSAATSSL
jgi:glucose/arabinose dehydrogenase